MGFFLVPTTRNLPAMSNALDNNRALWESWTALHPDSDFYDNAAFKAGKSSLMAPELELLGDVSGQRMQHLQCHFGQDSLSLARMGASVTGIDLSETAISIARNMASELNLDAQFIASPIHEAQPKVEQSAYDKVFTSYGVIGWLSELESWAQLIAHALKPGGRFVMVEFHPMFYMLDDDFLHLKYTYFHNCVVETATHSYTGELMPEPRQYHYYQHPVSVVLHSLLDAGLMLEFIAERDWLPYNCFGHLEHIGEGRWRSTSPAGKLMPHLLELVFHKPAQ